METFFLHDHCEDSPAEAAPKLSGHKRISSFLKPSKARLSRAESSDNKSKNITEALKLDEAVNAVNKFGQGLGNIVKTAMGTSSEDGNKTDKAPPSVDTTSSDSGGDVNSSILSPVVPYTRKVRRSGSEKLQEEDDLEDMGDDATLTLDDDRQPTEMVPSYSKPVPTFGSSGSFLGDLLENNPVVFAGIFVVTVAFLRLANTLSVTLDLDIELLLLFAAFCIGLHMPRPAEVPKAQGTLMVPPSTPRNSMREMMRREKMQSKRRVSLVSPDGKSAPITTFEIDIDDDMDGVMESPLPKFPEGAALGSKNNCWSVPVPTNFKVRGPKYLSDKVKVPSEPFIFPVRGVDLFLTDTCPENAGKIGGVFGGNLRELPTFIINFRLPWGILLAYFEIPERFIPFVKAAYDDDFDKSTLPSLDSMSNSDRCVARFLQGSDQQKNETLKIV